MMLEKRDTLGVNSYWLNLQAVHGYGWPGEQPIPTAPQIHTYSPIMLSVLLTSYVVDEVNQKILITQHCLLNETEHALLCETLDDLPNKTLEGLMEVESPIQEELMCFNQEDEAKILHCIPALFPEESINALSNTPITPAVNHKERYFSSSEKKEDPDWAFYFKCLCGLAILAGAILLAVCLLFPLPGLAIGGACILGLGSMGYFASSGTSNHQRKEACPAQGFSPMT